MIETVILNETLCTKVQVRKNVNRQLLHLVSAYKISFADRLEPLFWRYQVLELYPRHYFQTYRTSRHTRISQYINDLMDWGRHQPIITN